MVSMLNQAAIDALCSAAYLESYLDCVDDLPNDLQRTVTLLRELDCVTNDTMADIRKHHETWLACETMPDSTSSEKKRHVASQFQRSLGRMQEIGDQKLSLVAEIMENIESRIRQLDQGYDNLTNVGSLKEEEVTGSVSTTASVHTRQAASAVALSLPSADFSSSAITSPATGRLAKSEEKAEVAPVIKTGKRQKRLRNQQECISLDRDEKRAEEEEKGSTRKKKAKKERIDQSSVSHKITGIDPNEPLYCLCQQVSYGEMIGCDNEQCAIEWFHFDCVRLTHKPKGKWFCPRCRGSRPNIMNPDLLAEQQKRSDRSSTMKRYAD